MKLGEKVLKKAYICFYCKKLVRIDDGYCPHCGRPIRLIAVEYYKTRINPKWKFWKPQFKIEVAERRYKFIESGLK